MGTRRAVGLSIGVSHLRKPFVIVADEECFDDLLLILHDLVNSVLCAEMVLRPVVTLQLHLRPRMSGPLT